MENLEKLEKFIQAQHLEQSALDAIRSKPSREFVEGVVIDDFLHEEIIGRLQLVIDEEAVFQKHFKLFSNNDPVAEEVFYQSPEADRFLSRRYISGAKPEYLMSPNWLSYIKLKQFYGSAFVRYLEAISGLELEWDNHYTHSHQFEHYLKKHTDDHQHGKLARRICTVLYLSRGWKSEYGGDLKMCLEDGRERTIEAKCNRIVLFYPTRETSHYVTRHTELARDKTRTCHVAWYRDRV